MKRRYSASQRFRLYLITDDRGKDRWVQGGAFADFGRAKQEAIRRREQFPGRGVFAVVDEKPVKRTAGYIERDRVVFDTLTMQEAL